MKKGVITVFIISLCVAAASTLVFYFLYYTPHKKELLNTKQQILSFQGEITEQEKTIASIKKVISLMELEFVNINYFNRHNVQKEDKTPFFLKEFNELGNRLGIRFLSIYPGEPIPGEGFVKDIFEIHVQSDFRTLVLFLFNIQNQVGLNIDQINLHSEGSGDDLTISAIIGINSIEVINPRYQKASNLDELRFLHREYEPNLKDIKPPLERKTKKDARPAYSFLSKGKDPFIKPKAVKDLQKRLQKLEADLKESKLLGIIDFQGRRRAIIGNHTLKKGDKIFDMEVLDIGQDKVVLGNDEIRYTYEIEKGKENIPKRQGEP